MKQMSKLKKALPYILAILAGLSLTPWAVQAAYDMRGYNAIGGEALLIPLFLLVVLARDILKDERKEK